MNIVIGSALAAAATAVLVIAPANAAIAVPTHQHCVLTPSGFVAIGTGVSELAPHDTAFHNLHGNVHVGQPGDHLTVVAVDVGAPCPS
jgi:hypothetical protein